MATFTWVLIVSLISRLVKGSTVHTDFSDACVRFRTGGQVDAWWGTWVMRLAAEGPPRGIQRGQTWRPAIFLLLVVKNWLPNQRPPFQPPLQLSVDHEQSFCLWNMEGDACSCHETNLKRNTYPPLPVSPLTCPSSPPRPPPAAGSMVGPGELT